MERKGIEPSISALRKEHFRFLRLSPNPFTIRSLRQPIVLVCLLHDFLHFTEAYEDLRQVLGQVRHIEKSIIYMSLNLFILSLCCSFGAIILVLYKYFY
jgi:hypothetical protein